MAAIAFKNFVQLLQLLYWEGYHAAMLGYGVCDGLSNPPYRIRDNLHAARRIEALDRMDQANVSLVDEVGKREAVAEIPAGHAHDVAQITHDEFLKRRFVPRLCARRPLNLLLTPRTRE